MLLFKMQVAFGVHNVLLEYSNINVNTVLLLKDLHPLHGLLDIMHKITIQQSIQQNHPYAKGDQLSFFGFFNAYNRAIQGQSIGPSRGRVFLKNRKGG